MLKQQQQKKSHKIRNFIVLNNTLDTEEIQKQIKICENENLWVGQNVVVICRASDRYSF